jgi:HEAT repeat protein
VLRCQWIIIWIAFAAPGAMLAQTPTTPSIRSLMTQLSDVKTTGRDTAKQILEIAKKDSAAREYVAQRLPEVIKSGTDEPWLNAVWLPGKLKATEALPALQQAMSRPPFPAESYTSAGAAMRLANDIVAKALSEIGDPAIPATRELLGSPDQAMRMRAVLILTNIGTPAARKALQDRLSKESEQRVRDMMQNHLQSWPNGKSER